MANEWGQANELALPNQLFFNFAYPFPFWLRA
jgi:hypothetical protein